MGERLKEPTRNEPASEWPTALKVGLAFSFLWATVVIVYALTASDNGSSRLSIFWNAPPNEFGDALAGIFAPLAFLWLVVATFIQKEELGAQRNELRLSSTALSRQGDELSKQSELLLNTYAHEEKKALTQTLERELESITVRLVHVADRAYAVSELDRYGNRNSWRYVGYTSALSKYTDQDDFDAVLRSAAEESNRFCRLIDDNGFLPTGKGSADSEVATIVSSLEYIFSQVSNTDIAFSRRLERNSVYQLASNLRKILAFTANLLSDG